MDNNRKSTASSDRSARRQEREKARKIRRTERDRDKVSKSLKESGPTFIAIGLAAAVLLGLGIWVIKIISQPKPALTNEFSLYALVDNSASSGPFKKRLAQNTEKVRALIKKPVRGSVYRYSDRAEVIWSANTADDGLDERDLRRSLESDYLNVPPAGRKETHLARALEAIRKDLESQAPEPQAIVSIATDGGFEDMQAARTELSRWKGKNVLFLVHGVELIDGFKLPENLRRAFETYDNPELVKIYNRQEFDEGKIKTEISRFREDLTK
ncbi:MAG: hypothetical protein RLY39_800 [Actinomycetota bacterium]|jgi:hypothetical protein